LLLAEEDPRGKLVQATGLQAAGLLDDLYAAAVQAPPLGAALAGGHTDYRLWAPTAQQVLLCSYASAHSPADSASPLRLDAATGVWNLSRPSDDRGRYYRYLVDVFVPGAGIVRNRVTDPYR
jgi:1,4-alpha-glucan branching enzyme